MGLDPQGEGWEARAHTPMLDPMRSLLTLLAFAAATCALQASPAVASAPGCGSGTYGKAGYGYAGHQAATAARGIQATVTMTRAPDVRAGHAAGWIGVGGPGAGRDGSDQWLQVGIAAIPGLPPMLYVEVARDGRPPLFTALEGEAKAGSSYRLELLELAGRPDWWQVSVDGTPVTRPVYLAGSSGRFRPIATAESWSGGRAVCNAFSFRFDGVRVVAAQDGSWRPFPPGFRFQDRGFRVGRAAPDTGPERNLASPGPSASFAFVAASASAG